MCPQKNKFDRLLPFACLRTLQGDEETTSASYRLDRPQPSYLRRAPAVKIDASVCSLLQRAHPCHDGRLQGEEETSSANYGSTSRGGGTTENTSPQDGGPSGSPPADEEAPEKGAAAADDLRDLAAKGLCAPLWRTNQPLQPARNPRPRPQYELAVP